MIEINLLPEELKTGARNRKAGVGSEYFLYLIPLAFGILISAHIYFAAVSIIKHCQYSALDNKWRKLQPQREMLNNFKNQYDTLLSGSQAMQQLNIRRLTWSEKLNKLSLDLPPGIWFNEVSFSHAEFILKGSAISLQKEEMILIGKFIDSLKKEESFARDLNNLELSSVQRRSIGGYDIVDFILTGKLKPR